jgi:microcystin-dependent protein
MSITKVQGGFIDSNAVNSANIADGSVTPAKLSIGGPSWDTSGNTTINGTLTSGSNSITGTNSTGGGQAHENRPPYYALAFIMRTV